MDTIRSKRRSLSKSKLIMSFYRATKPSSAPLQPYSSKPPKPSPSNGSSLPSSAAAGPPKGFIIVNQDQVFHQQTPKVAFVVKDNKRDSYEKLDNFYGGGAAEDEGVDEEADRYISSVQERFRLDMIN